MVSKLVSNDVKVQINLKECFVKNCHGKAICNCVTQKQLIWNECYECAWRGCNQFGAISNGRWCARALVPPPRLFERERYSYSTKYGKCFEMLKKSKALIKVQLEYKIMAFWSNNGREFISKAFERFWRTITLRSKCPPCIGIIKRESWQNVQIAPTRDGEKHASCLNPLSIILGGKNANAVYIQNWCPTRALDYITPEKTWNGRRLQIYVCLDALSMQWCRMKKR